MSFRPSVSEWRNLKKINNEEISPCAHCVRLVVRSDSDGIAIVRRKRNRVNDKKGESCVSAKTENNKQTYFSEYLMRAPAVALFQKILYNNNCISD